MHPAAKVRQILRFLMDHVINVSFAGGERPIFIQFMDSQADGLENVVLILCFLYTGIKLESAAS